ncbi:MAG: CBS domain-containing protein [Thaumarchaeota archaeon]|nr:CBS domain-containing protein [Nitrososphaerota archaeon]
MPEVRDFMMKEVLTIEPTQSVLQAAILMAEKGEGSIVVIDGGVVKGIVTERDLLFKVTAKHMDPATLKVTEIMSSPLISINPQASIREATKIMIDNKIRRLAVITDGALVGMISVWDVTQSILNTIARDN